MKTNSKILNKDFEFKTVHIGLFLSDDLWLNDKWGVTIENEYFEYHTGTGHRVEKDRFSREEFKKVMNKIPRKERENLLMYIKEVEKVSKVKPLEIDDVLYSLILDSDALEYPFKDFCDNFGYEEDSRKAFDIYNQCIESGHKVKKFIPNINEARELFHDY